MGLIDSGHLAFLLSQESGRKMPTTKDNAKRECSGCDELRGPVARKPL